MMDFLRRHPFALLFAAAGVWMLQEWLGWYAANLGCADARPHRELWFAEGAVNLLALTAAITLLTLAWRRWRRAPGAEGGMDRFVLLLPVPAAAAFLVGVFWSTWALLMPACEAMR
jgi:hypothetical protein